MTESVTNRHDFARYRRWAVSLVVLLAFAVRFYRLGGQPLWYDEILQLQLARARADVIWGNVRVLPLGPLYTYLLKIWIAWVGSSELAVRFIPASAGVLGIAVFYRYLRIWLSMPAALIGSLLLTLSPFHLYFSQEGRPYTLVVALLLAALCAFRQVLCDQRRRWMVFHGLLLASAGYLHYTALLAIGGEAAWILAARPKDWSRWKRVFASWALAGLAMIWIIPDASQALLSVYGVYENTIEVVSTVQTVAAGFGKYGSFPDYGGAIIRQIAPFTLLGLLILALPLWKSRRVIWAVSLGAVGLQFGWTFILLPLTKTIANPSFNERHFLWAVPFVFAIAALGVQYVLDSRHQSLRLLAGVFLGVTMVLYVAGDAGYFYRYLKSEGKAAVDFVTSKARADDLILCNTRAAATAWSVYGKPQLTAWDKPRQVDGKWQFSPQVGLVFGEQVEWIRTWEQVLTRSRVWVFYLPGQGPVELISDLRSVYSDEQKWTFGNITVFRFKR